jgi:two-component system sensor histidine kinase PilS (NtrC family)
VTKNALSEKGIGMTIDQDSVVKKEKNTRRLFFLIISRVFIVSIFLGTTVFIDIKRQSFAIPQITINFFYIIAAAIYLLSVIYMVMFRFGVKLKKNIFIQIAVDILIITGLIFTFGNTQIDFSLFYTLIIIYSAIFLGRKGGLIVASISSILYGLLLDLEFYNLMPFSSFITHEYELTAADVLTNIIVRITAFYVLAFLVSFVVEQEKKATSMLEEKESEFNQLDLLFRSIVESVYTGVMTIDLRNFIKTFNQAAEEITGFARSKVEGRRIDDVFPEFLPFLNEEMTEKQLNSRMEVIVKGKEGDKINLGLSVSPLRGRSENKIGNILIFQDLTKIKEMEKTIENSRNMALIGEMAAGWAHEVRNPLAAITGSIELLKQGLTLEGTNKRLMEIVLRSKEQLESFARDFLLLARPVPVSKESVDLSDVTEEVLESIKLSPDWSDKINVRKNLSKNLRAFANREQVRQIINNLALNAVQSMEDNGVLSIETKTIKSDDDKKYAEIKIMDNGCGIEEDDLNKIFEPFFTKKSKGTGLGLTIVSHIIDGYKGKIKIESEKNKGTTCMVWLPLEQNIQSLN